MNFNPLLYMLAAKPEISPVMPPPTDIRQSFLWKFFFRSMLIILFTFLKFLFISLELKKYIDLSSPIKTLGEHEIHVKFSSDISGSFKLTIEKED